VKLFHIYLGLVVIETILLFYFSILPYPEGIDSAIGIKTTDKVKHFLAYAVYGILLKKVDEGRNKNTKMPLAVGIFVSLTTELVQYLVPTRVSDVLDIAANIGGVLSGLSLILLFQPLKGYIKIGYNIVVKNPNY